MKKTTFLALLILGGTILFLVWWFVFKSAGDVPSYSEFNVERRTIERVILSTGEVKPRNRLEIKPAIAGRIEEVLIREGDKVTRGQRLAWMSSTERAALIDAARSRGEAEVERWSSFYRPTAIISPIDGMVISRQVEPGQSFSTSDVLFVLSDKLAVKALVDETDLALITIGQEARVILDAFPQRQIDAQVEHIAFESKAVNNVINYEIDVIPAQEVEFMRSGMTANINFLLEEAKDVLSIPVTAVVREGRERFILVPGTRKGSTQRVAITTGIDDGRFVEVTSGLEIDQTILVPSLPRGGNQRGGTGGSPFVPQRGGRR
jgi:membrane fusion protein, macrolide-specific efflux system